MNAKRLQLVSFLKATIEKKEAFAVPLVVNETRLENSQVLGFDYLQGSIF